MKKKKNRSIYLFIKLQLSFHLQQLNTMNDENSLTRFQKNCPEFYFPLKYLKFFISTWTKVGVITIKWGIILIRLAGNEGWSHWTRSR